MSENESKKTINPALATSYLQKIKPSYRCNDPHAGAQSRSFGYMVMVNGRIVIQMLCRVVMELSVKICHSFLSVVGKL